MIDTSRIKMYYGYIDVIYTQGNLELLSRQNFISRSELLIPVSLSLMKAPAQRDVELEEVVALGSSKNATSASHSVAKGQ